MNARKNSVSKILKGSPTFSTNDYWMTILCEYSLRKVFRLKSEARITHSQISGSTLLLFREVSTYGIFGTCFSQSDEYFGETHAAHELTANSAYAAQQNNIDPTRQWPQEYISSDTLLPLNDSVQLHCSF